MGVQPELPIAARVKEATGTALLSDKQVWVLKVKVGILTIPAQPVTQWV